MTRASAVEWAWIAPLLPRLDEVDTERLMRGGATAEAPPMPQMPTCVEMAPAAPAPQPTRRNDSAAVEAAQRRFAERRSQAKPS